MPPTDLDPRDRRPPAKRRWWRLALLALALFNPTLARAGDEPSITIAVEDAAAPWSAADGTGYANDIVTAAFAAAGWRVQLKVVPYARCKHLVLSGEIAGCFTVGRIAELEGVLLFPDRPLFVARNELYAIDSSSIMGCDPRSWVPTARIGSVNGYEYGPDFQRIAASGLIQSTQAPTEATLLRLLARHRIDIALLSLGDGKPLDYVMGEAGSQLRLRKICTLEAVDSYIAFSPRHPLGKAALAAFNRGFEMIVKSGEQAAIVARWSQAAALRLSQVPANN